MNREFQIKNTDYMEVADRLYRFLNPETKMDTPNSVYITTEKRFHEWAKSDTDQEFYDWCIENK